MKFISIKKNSKWLYEIQKLGDANRQTLGFLPSGAFEDYAAKGHIVIATEKNTLIGYLMYRYKGTKIIIVHFCIASDYRRKHIAHQLLGHLEQKEENYYSDIQLYCRRDYHLDKFWNALGFSPMAEKQGRSTKKETVLTLWIKRNIESISLFDADLNNTSDETIQAVLDSNIVIDMSDKNNPDVNLLLQDYLRNYVTWYVTNVFFDEINTNENPEQRNKHRMFAQNHCTTIDKYDYDTMEIIRNELLNRKPATRNTNRWFDLTHIAIAIVFGATLFITNDQEWLNNSFSEFVLERFGLSILPPVVFLKYLDEVNTPSVYSPRSLAGLDLKYSEVTSEDYSLIVNALYSQYPTQKKAHFKELLKRWIVNSETHKTLFISSKKTPVSLVLYRIEDNKEIVDYLLTDPKQVKPRLHRTFFKRIAFMLLSKASEYNINQIIVRTESMSTECTSAFCECGYFFLDNCLNRFTFDRVIDVRDISTIIKSNFASNTIPQLRFFQEVSLKNDVFRLINLEKAFWPLKISDEQIPCYIVPIQAKYAQELFDEELANINLSLFPSDKPEASLSIENVYFKKKAQTISSYPARILWYVSNDPRMFGTKAIRACSYLDHTETATMKQLYTKYRRFGVLTWDDMKKIEEPEKLVSAYLFSYTEIFPKEVTLEDVRKILDRPTETFTSYKRISQSHFLNIYRLGKYGKIDE